MDAYQPICDTIKPCITAAAVDEPWHSMSGTQTVFWYVAPTPIFRAGGSSQDRLPTTFFILDTPAALGLERLRTFKGWRDNWDAEGSKAPNPAVIDFASKVFGLLALHGSPVVTMTAEGHPMFVYGAPLNGEVVVTAPDKFDYFFTGDGAPEGEDISLAGNTLPADLIAYLHSV